MAQKKKKKSKSGCFGCLFRLALLAAVVWVIVMLIGNSLPLLFKNQSSEVLSTNVNLSNDWANILLLGCDFSDATDGRGRTDTMIIASIHKGTGVLKLTSIMRDTIVPIPGHGSNKINAAYRLGGADLAMKTVNEAFGMNITQYALVDFTSFAYLVEGVGGINLPVTQQERDALNEVLHSMYRMFKGTGISPEDLSQYGDSVHLNGAQALAYSRIRKLDSDYMRTSRQRTVIDTLIKKIRATRNPVRLINLATTALQYVDTNLDLPQITSLGLKMLGSSARIEQNRVPFDGTYESGTKNGTWSIRPNLSQNQEKLRSYIYE